MEAKNIGRGRFGKKKRDRSVDNEMSSFDTQFIHQLHEKGMISKE